MPALLLERRVEDCGKFPDDCSYKEWGWTGRSREGNRTIFFFCPNHAYFGFTGERILSQMPGGWQTHCRKQLKPSELDLGDLLLGTFLDILLEGACISIAREVLVQGAPRRRTTQTKARAGSALGQQIFLKHQIAHISGLPTMWSGP